MSFDDLGRFYTCHESSAAFMDYLPEQYLRRNPNLLALSRQGGGNRDRFGVDVHISRRAQEVFPIRPTPQITLGGLELRDDGTLRTYTVVAGTCVYRGDQFPADARGNLFVPESGGHLIGRLVLEGDLAPTARRFYPARQELLASTDERFRPVNARTGPDGALYLADMYKGIIEHVIFMVPWVADQVKARNLETGNDLGRIWRIVSTEGPISRKSPALSSASPRELVETLRHPNGWRRDTAQRLLVDRRPGEAIPILKEFARNGGSPLGRMHALWTLAGMGALDWNTGTAALNDGHHFVRATALRVLEPLVTPGPAPKFVEAIAALLARGESNPIVLQQAILSLGAANTAPAAFGLLLELYEKRTTDLGHTAMLSALHGREGEFLDYLVRANAGANPLEEDLSRLLQAGGIPRDPWTAARIDLNALTAEQRALTKLGAEKYALFCASCHQPYGTGAQGVAPPLAKSEWVNGPPQRLAQIVLRGIVGPLKVRGQEWNLHMPGLGNAGVVSDKEFAAIMTFIRRAWGNRAEPIDAELVKTERERSDARKFPWTAAELAGESAPADLAAIKPGADGRIELHSKAAKLFAQKLRYHPNLDLIGPWVIEGDAALWRVAVPAAATYQVELVFAMDDKNAGNTWVIETDLSELEGKVASTGSFDRFKTVKAGTLKLKKGLNRLLMRPAGAPKGELIDLRAIRLVPLQP